MQSTIQVGTVLMRNRPLMTQFLELETQPCSGEWTQVKALDGVALDRKLHAAGWNFFLMATEVKVIFFGALAANKVQNALKRIVRRVTSQDFNCLEVTGLVAKSFLGVPYTAVFAHSRHIQQSCQLHDIERRQADHRDTEWARG